MRSTTKGDNRLFGEWINRHIIQSQSRNTRRSSGFLGGKSLWQRIQTGTLVALLTVFTQGAFPPGTSAQDDLARQSDPLGSSQIADPDIANPLLEKLKGPVDPITAIVNVGVDPERPSRRSESWVPLTVELENHVEALKGHLIVRMKGGTIDYSVPINLPPKAKKSYDLTVFFPHLLDELEFYIHDGRKETLIEVVTVPTAYSETDRFIAVISSERGSHDRYNHRPQDPKTDLYRRVLYTHPSFLPRNVIGYQSLDILMWDGGPLTMLSPEQDKALESWIQMGGTFILAVGEYGQDLADSPFRLYSPMTLTGSRTLEAGTTLENPNESEKPVLQSSVVIATGEMLDDPHCKLLLKADNDPFLIERKWGAGRIVWIASSITNPLFTSPLHQTIFKDFLSKSHLPLSSKIVESMDDYVTRFLRLIIQAELPGTWFIAIYLGCYILLVVPINYIVFRMIGRLEWAWFTVPIWAILFAYGAYYIGALRQQGQVTVNEISVVEARASANTAQSTTYCSIYSPVRSWYTLLFDDPIAFPQQIQGNLQGNPMGRANISSEDLKIQFSNGISQVNEFMIFHWSQRSIKTQHEVKIGKGLDIDLQWSNNQITGTIHNQTGKTLYNPTLYVKNHSFNIPNLEPDATHSIDQDLTVTRPFAPQDNPIQFMQQNQNKQKMTSFVEEELKNAYSSAFFTEYPSLGMAILAARIDQPQQTFKINDRLTAPKEGQTLLCQIFPLKEKITGRLLLQNDAWSFSTPSFSLGDRSQPIPIDTQTMGFYGGMGGMGGMGAMPNNMNNRMTQFQTPANSLNQWDLTSDISLLESRIESMQISVNYERMGFIAPRPSNQAAKFELIKGKPADPQYELQLQDQFDKTWKPLSQITDPNGDIIEPGRFVDKVTSVITVRLESPTDRSLQINLDAFQIQLMVNFGTEAGGKFLGYYIDTISTEKADPKKKNQPIEELDDESDFE